VKSVGCTYVIRKKGSCDFLGILIDSAISAAYFLSLPPYFDIIKP
jgi:hypothetical protein